MRGKKVTRDPHHYITADLIVGDMTCISKNILIKFQLIFKKTDQFCSNSTRSLAELEGFELRPVSAELEERILYIRADSESKEVIPDLAEAMLLLGDSRMYPNLALHINH